jgi:hypothetical protein
LSESHWGEESLKWGALAVVGAVAFMAGMIGLWFWAPWEKPTEVEWLVAYETWSDGIEATYTAGGALRRSLCESSYDEDVGNPPTERLEPVSAAALRGCATLSAASWRSAQAEVVRRLMTVHGVEAPPRLRPDYAEIAQRSVGVRARVYCWNPLAWAPFSEHYGVVRGGEEIWLKGIVDPARRRIDLDPGVCAALGRYKHRVRPIAISYQNFELAEALMVFTHEAERLKAPSASQIDLACYAVQHVRPLIAAAGWDAEYQQEMALQAWDLGYTQLPPYFRTPACRNGGPLDRNPGSNAWP